jgi:hypothetical protein
MTTITRDELRAAIEAGIKRATALRPESFTIDAATKLRAVADTATHVATGVYSEEDPDVPGSWAACPVAQAFPDRWPGLAWDTAFTDAYDRAIHAARPERGGHALEVVEASS